MDQYFYTVMIQMQFKESVHFPVCQGKVFLYWAHIGDNRSKFEQVVAEWMKRQTSNSR